MNAPTSDSPKHRVSRIVWPIVLTLGLLPSAVTAQLAVESAGGAKRFFLGGSFGLSTLSFDVTEDVRCRSGSETHFSVHGGMLVRENFHLVTERELRWDHGHVTAQ